MRHALAALLLLVSVSAYAADDYCQRCPRSYIDVKTPAGVVKMPFLGRCSVLGSAGDECNKCMFAVWCDPASGKWYRSVAGICSTLVCEGKQALSQGMKREEGVEIPNPYAPAGGK